MSAAASDLWSWWQDRRRDYNLALAAAGVLAYGLTLLLVVGFGHPLWPSWREAASTTLRLGAGFLLVVGAANVCYLAGPALEAWLRPANLAQYRRDAYALGVRASLAVPFLLPVMMLARLLGGAA